MNYSLRTLLIVAAGAAVVCASLAYPEPLVGDFFYTLGLLLIAFGTIAALYFRGQRRAYWVGFLILFAGYFCHSVWPGEIRSTWTIFQSSGGMRFPAQGLVTGRLLSYAYEGLHPNSPAAQRSGRQVPGFSPSNETAGKFIAFMTVGHTAIALLLGIGGGLIAQRFAAQTPLTRRPLEKILSDMDVQ